MTSTTPAEVLQKTLFIEAPKEVINFIWKSVASLVVENWFILLIVLLVISIIFTFKALLGYWGLLGSLMYNLTYFFILFILGLIFGPELFIKNWFSAFLVLILHPICFYLSGLIINKFK